MAIFRLLRLEGTFLRSRLGRRIFGMFCVAVILPAAMVVLLTHRAAQANAVAASEAAQRVETKTYAMTLFERLHVAQALLNHGERGSGRIQPGAIDEPLLRPYFAAVERFDPHAAAGERTTPLARLLQMPAGSLEETGLLVLPAQTPGDQAGVVLLEHRPTPVGGTVVAGLVRPSFLWGEVEEIAVRSRICVEAGDVRLTCVGQAPDGLEGSELITDTRDLFLAAAFSAPAWTLSATRELEPALATRLVFLVPVAIGMLLLVLLLSSIEIRRILVPLDALLGRIKAVGQGAGVEQARGGGDELLALSSTFGQMEARIDRQIETLRTLSRIDQLILQRLPVAAVVEVIIEQTLLMLPDATVGLTLEDRHGARQHFVRSANQRSTRMSDSSLDAPLDAALLHQHHEVGGWRTDESVGPALQRLGLSTASVLAIGSPRACAWMALACEPQSPLPRGLLAEVSEMAERVAIAMAVQEHESVLQFQARHDLLTGLPNRLAANEALGKAIAQCDLEQGAFAVIFIDLDRFKSINDGMGHSLGDQILVRTAERIRQCIGSADLVARFGGDEFFVLLRDVHGPAEAARVIARLSSAFKAPMLAEGIELVVGFSAGIALYPRHGGDAAELIHNSDVAMYRAKKKGGGRLEFFEAEMNEAALGRVQMENDLRMAIRASALTVHYQPRVDSRSGRIVGAEALVRWVHPAKGNIPPVVFIPLAEECGLIDELGQYVLGEACRQLGDWRRAGLLLPIMAINISSYQLGSGALIEAIGTAVDVAGIGWSDLEIEVTESLLINDIGGASAQLQAIRESGATVAIDDFGTGYSSLAYLTRLPIDTLKIDRAFISDLDSPGAATVVRSIIALATALDKSVVAEGVESKDHVRALAGWGCHVIQGYAYHRPLHPQDMATELARDPATRLAGAQDHSHSSAT